MLVVAGPPWEPYKFEELIKINPFVLTNDGSHYAKLRYDYDFIFPENEKIQIKERNTEWNQDMSFMRNRIKDARTKQKKLYLEMMVYKTKRNSNMVTKLRGQIKDLDQSIHSYVRWCNSLRDEPWSDEEARKG